MRFDKKIQNIENKIKNSKHRAKLEKTTRKFLEDTKNIARLLEKGKTNEYGQVKYKGGSFMNHEVDNRLLRLNRIINNNIAWEDKHKKDFRKNSKGKYEYNMRSWTSSKLSDYAKGIVGDGERRNVRLKDIKLAKEEIERRKKGAFVGNRKVIRD